MDKLTRYNQKLLAIIGTAVLITASISILIGLGAFIFSIFDDIDGASGIRLQNQAQIVGDTIEYKRLQEITFDKPYQIDTNKSLFLIPVGLVNLESEKKIALSSEDRRQYLKSSYSHEWFLSNYGIFNNFILYNDVNKSSSKIFNERVTISRWGIFINGIEDVIIFQGSNTDTNSDNKIDNGDFQLLYVYYLSDGKLVKYKFHQKTVIDFENLKKTNLIAISLGADSNNDFKFDDSIEPKEILTLNLKTRNLIEIIPPGLKSEIQLIIDGIDK